MRRFTLWIGGLALAGLLSATVWAQSLVTVNLSGSFLLAQLGVGGSSVIVPDYVLRSGENHQLVATGTTVNTTVNANAGILLATGAITTWNVTLPTSPYAGERVIINCPGGTVSTLSITATSPASVSIVGTSPTSCTSGGAIANGVGFVYSATANIWYRYI